MATRVLDTSQAESDFIRRRALTAHNNASLRTVVDIGEHGTFVLDEPVEHGGTGTGPAPLKAVIGALCGCEAVTFHRAAAESGFSYDALDFDASFTIDVRGKDGDRSVRPHFQSVRVRAVVATQESPERLQAVVEETEARCPVLNLLRDAGVDLQMEWVLDPAG